MSSLRSSLFGSAVGLNAPESKVPRLQELCTRTICAHLFTPEQETVLKFDPAALYALPESLKPVLIATLRGALPDEVLEALLRYASFVLRDSNNDNNWSFVPRAQYFRERYNDLTPACAAPLRLFVFSELLRLSQAVHFDSVFISVALAGTTLDHVPVPPTLPLLRRLEVREGLYELSPGLISAAPYLEWLALEGDEVVRADGTDFLQQVENQTSLRHLELRRVICGATPAEVQRAFQRLRSTQLHTLAIRKCDEFPLGPILGFLLKRLESLTHFALDGDNVPMALFGNLAACDNLTHISLRECRCVTGSQLVTLAKGAYHIVELDLSRSSVDSKKLHKLAQWVAGGLGEQLPALQTLHLSGLQLSCAAVLAAMKCAPSLRALLLEETAITMRDPKQDHVADAPKRKVKKKDSNKPKTKRVDLNKVNKGKRKPKARIDTDELIEAGLSATTVTELYMTRSRATSWCAAQIIAHCPDLEKLECAAMDSESWCFEDVSAASAMRFNMIVSGPKNESGINFKQSDPLAVAIFTRRNLRLLNLLCCEPYQHVRWPDFKLLPAAPQWPHLETLLVPHPRRYLPNFAWPSLTRLVLCTNADVPVLSLLKSLQLVVYYGHRFSPHENHLWRLRTVPRVMLVRCTITLRSYVSWIADAQEFWESHDTKLKEIVIFDCNIENDFDVDNVGRDHVPAALYDTYMAQRESYSRKAPESTPELPCRLSPHDKFYLHTCFTRVKHRFLERKSEFDTVWGDVARGTHPEARADDTRVLWPFGKLSGEIELSGHYFDMTWSGE